MIIRKYKLFKVAVRQLTLNFAAVLLSKLK